MTCSMALLPMHRTTSINSDVGRASRAKGAGFMAAGDEKDENPDDEVPIPMWINLIWPVVSTTKIVGKGLMKVVDSVGAAGIQAGTAITAIINPELTAEEKALADASAKGDTARLKQLLSDKINVNADRDKGTKEMTALHRAAEAGHVEVTRLLLDAGADMNSEHSGKPESGQAFKPLHLAARRGHTEVVKLMLSPPYKADVNQTPSYGNNKGMTPLHFAADWGQVDVVKLLLKQQKVDIELKGSNGWTARRYAESRRSNDFTTKSLKGEYTKIIELIDAKAAA
uniref:Uncharacterized protein n=1 Tax=Haptolina brevifila TaxID=156173 RepID=A0A7S2HJR2_9EUKA